MPAPDVLILSKRYDEASLGHARSLRESCGTKLVLDLCDNHFFNGAGEANWGARAHALRSAVGAVDRVVASSAALAEVVASEVPGHPPIEVVGDAAEEPAMAPGFAPRLRHAVAEWRLWRLQRDLAFAHVPWPRRAVWFGNHGSPNAEGGMNDLLLVKHALEHECASSPLSLTVISNSKPKFLQLRSSWPTPIFYLPWNASSFSRALRLHSVCLLPIRPNPFTACKTSNRIAAALLHGLAVIADPIPSYQEFAPFVYLGDWTASLRAAMGPAAEVRSRVDRGADHVRRLHSIDKIADSWLAVAVNACGCRSPSK
jgi:hypothetical protein